jgi:hypothetical protein
MFPQINERPFKKGSSKEAAQDVTIEVFITSLSLYKITKRFYNSRDQEYREK